MTADQAIAILPFIILGALIILVMLLIAVRRNHLMTAVVSALGLLLCLFSLPFAAAKAPILATPLLAIDGYTLFFVGLILASALAVVLFSYAYLEQTNSGPREEYYLLLLTATLGAIVLPGAVHFASFFLGLETLSVSLLGLIAYPGGQEAPAEAGTKYLILSGTSSAFLLFGMALIYADLGTMSFAQIGQAAIVRDMAGFAPYRLAGIALILVGVGFKLSLVPFHMWAPDIYQGAPAPITGFVAVVSKIAVFAVILRYFGWSDAYRDPSVLDALAVIAVLSMLAGNLLALLQNNVKRLLAYSSIAHLGYLLVAFLVGGDFGFAAAGYYLAAYAVTSLAAFGVVALLTKSGEGRDADRIEDYQGLFRTQPFLAGCFTLTLLSLAGIPPTMGFIGKAYLLIAGVGAGFSILVAALVLGSVIGLYYYLRIVVAMAAPASQDASTAGRGPVLAGSVVLGVLLILLVTFGAYPSPIIDLIRSTVGHWTLS
ncbi:MAG TPA: NADH-quinone oxidoreductase subunit N [Stellaceae bacterium]|nr:NADH-quinone oxidoreductase subunit N [Stellaceae bacterium]